MEIRETTGGRCNTVQAIVSYIICIANAGFTDHILKQGIVQIAELKMHLPFLRQEPRLVPGFGVAYGGGTGWVGVVCRRRKGAKLSTNATYTWLVPRLLPSVG
jgi:hypothetical protein